MDIETIIEHIKNRDENGLRELLKQSEPLIRYIISPILSNKEDEDECLSDILLRIWDKIDTFDPEKGAWNTWITAISRNTARNRAKRSQHRLSGDDLSDDMPSFEPTPEENMLLYERRTAIHRALASLSGKDRMLFYRKYYYMQSTAQIASELGMTERAVEGKLYRLKKKLRDMLGGETHA